MKDQLQTIRENAERIAASGIKGPQGCADRILAALAELEKQEPVGYYYPAAAKEAFDDQMPGELYQSPPSGRGHIAALAKPLYAAPVAQHSAEVEVQCPVCNHKFWEWPVAQQPQAEAPGIALNKATPVTSWNDSRTQKVYEVLTNDNYPPKGSEEHWEGWKARLVVDALFPEQLQAEKRCQYCDGTGDVHSIDGQWRGECHCQKQPQALPPNRIREIFVKCGFEAKVGETDLTPYMEDVAEALLAEATQPQAEAVPSDVTDAMVDAYLSFASQATHLHHPEVPYHGTVNGDDADLWRRRLIKLALQRALAAAPK